jgi:tRNA(fMet)-specific endonuclease VapC
MFLLDTDLVSLDQRGHALVRQRVQSAGSLSVVISAITVEEQLRGWLATIRTATTTEARVYGYLRLRMAVEYAASFTILDYTAEIDTLVIRLRQQGIRIGTLDLRIAATALINGVTLVTRNSKDFDQIPGLITADWSLPQP